MRLHQVKTSGQVVPSQLPSLLSVSWSSCLFVFSVNFRISMSSSRRKKNASGCFYLEDVQFISYLRKNGYLSEVEHVFPVSRPLGMFQRFPPGGFACFLLCLFSDILSDFLIFYVSWFFGLVCFLFFVFFFVVFLGLHL